MVSHIFSNKIPSYCQSNWRLLLIILFLLVSTNTMAAITPPDTTFKATGNPIIKHKYTADPAALVYKDKVYLYTGHDEAPLRREGYVMKEWLVFS